MIPCSAVQTLTHHRHLQQKSKYIILGHRTIYDSGRFLRNLDFSNSHCDTHQKYVECRMQNAECKLQLPFLAPMAHAMFTFTY